MPAWYLRALTLCRCAANVRTHSPVSASQHLTVLSALPEYTCRFTSWGRRREGGAGPGLLPQQVTRIPQTTPCGGRGARARHWEPWTSGEDPAGGTHPTAHPRILPLCPRPRPRRLPRTEREASCQSLPVAGGRRPGGARRARSKRHRMFLRVVTVGSVSCPQLLGKNRPCLKVSWESACSYGPAAPAVPSIIPAEDRAAGAALVGREEPWRQAPPPPACPS